MKKAFSVITLVLLLSSPTAVGAATASVSATPQDDKTRQIEDLKERLATKVAQLRQEQRKAIAGTVKSVSLTTTVVETKTKDVKIELTDDIKIVQLIKGKRAVLPVDNLAKGDAVVVFGLYDVTLDLLRAKVIFIDGNQPLRVSGVISDISRDDFTITVATAEKQNFVVDIEKSTKTNLWSRDSGVSKGGFSRMAIGNTIHVVGTPVPKKENRISAQRILDLGNLTGTPLTSPPSATSAAATPKATATPAATL